MLLYDKKVPRNIWRTAIVTRLLPRTDFQIREAIARIAKTNTILKHPLNKLFAVENTCHGTKQTYNGREKKLSL